MQREAVIQMPNMSELGGAKPQRPAFVRMPFFPTAPYYSTRENVGYQTRFYGATLLPTDADYTQNGESIRIVQFDMPCTLVAINGSAFRTNGAAFNLGYRPNDTYLFRIEYSTGDKLMTAARLASTVLGTSENPGEIGGYGYTINPGASVVLGITPLLADTRIDITLACLEARGPSNYTLGG
jgi:hypothetical protein